MHSILVHRGSLAAGHYFAFIRPSLDNLWYEFNDSHVTPVVQSTAFSIGYGGLQTTFSVKDGIASE